MRLAGAAHFSWGWIARSLLLRQRQIVLLCFVILSTYGTALVLPISAQKALDVIVAGQAVGWLIGLVLVVAASILAESALSYYRQTLTIELATFIDRRMARRVFAYLLRLKTRFGELPSGETINHFQQVTKIRDFVIFHLPNIVFEVGSASVSLLVMFYYDFGIACGFLVIALLSMAAIRKPLDELYGASEAYYEDVGRRHNLAAETVNGIATIKALADESTRMRRWIASTETTLGTLRRLLRLNRTFAVRSQLGSRSLLLFVLILGCLRLYQGQISVGDLLALQLLASRIADPLLQSGNFLDQYQEANVAIGQIDAFLASPRERAAIHPPLSQLRPGEIAFRGVTLVYPGSTQVALDNIDLVLPERGIVALVGRNGSGKTSLIKVLLGLCTDYSGRVEISGHDLKNYDPRALRKNFGVVYQDTVLFSGTIRENLAGGRVVDDAAIREGLRFSGALDCVESLPGGLDAEIGEYGRTMSGGQRQRLAIARAIIRNPKIALFDEPTAFLDAEAAIALERKLASWGQERLLVLVSHNLAATRNLERILVLDGGRLVGDGRHDDLLQNSSRYASLWADYLRVSNGSSPQELRT